MTNQFGWSVLQGCVCVQLKVTVNVVVSIIYTRAYYICLLVRCVRSVRNF